MGISLISSTGSGEGPRVRVQMPVSTGLQLLSYFGQSLDLSRANRARRAATPAALIVSAPTVSSSKITLDETGGLAFPDSVETADLTLILAARAVDTSQSSNEFRFPGVGWHVATANRGAQFFSGGSTVMRYRADFTSSGTPSNVQGALATVAGEQNVQRIWAFVVKNGVGMTLYDLTKGASHSVADTTARAPYAGPLKIGPYLGGNGGFGDYYGLCHHTAALTKSDIDLQAAAMARFLKDVRGVTGLIPGI